MSDQPARTSQSSGVQGPEQQYQNMESRRPASRPPITAAATTAVQAPTIPVIVRDLAAPTVQGASVPAFGPAQAAAGSFGIPGHNPGNPLPHRPAPGTSPAPPPRVPLDLAANAGVSAVSPAYYAGYVARALSPMPVSVPPVQSGWDQQLLAACYGTLQYEDQRYGPQDVRRYDAQYGGPQRSNTAYFQSSQYQVVLQNQQQQGQQGAWFDSRGQRGNEAVDLEEQKDDWWWGEADEEVGVNGMWGWEGGF
ncbi:hypothetical protein M501DRAFT_990362 [Patellaria atrata CBS 101060]|uniref:Uncharacterized protein n=1 Tax=Patellaria atrata CBS 101060 TaxID=1346257 RepID=A0A9P4VND6_9PEZI|nr:hypothetical protein M501DRAFT_990362 [Patellaria atrata CBS 101060]